MMTGFYFTLFDRNFCNNYAYHSNSNVDDSGFAKVTLELYDTDTITRNAFGSIVPVADSVGVSYVLYDYADHDAATRTSRPSSSGRVFKTAIDSSANTYEWEVRDKLLDTTYLTNQSYSSLSLKAKINTMAEFPGAATLSNSL